MTSHVVEFWPMPPAEVQKENRPHEVPCAGPAEAIELEARFHAVGWAARAVTLSVQRDYPTAGYSRQSNSRY